MEHSLDIGSLSAASADPASPLPAAHTSHFPSHRERIPTRSLVTWLNPFQSVPKNRSLYIMFFPLVVNFDGHYRVFVYIPMHAPD